MPPHSFRSMPALHGIIPPLVTPLLADGSLDEPGLTMLVERVIDGGVHGLFVLGTTGEWASLDDRVRRRVLEVCAETANGRVPLYVHVTDTRLSASLAMARYALDAGAAAIVASAPYYLPLQQSELEHYARLLLDRQDLPVILYNIPQFTQTRYAPETVERLVDDPRVMGIKDSSGELDYQRLLIDLARDYPHFSVLCGNEAFMVEMLASGAHGCVGGGANLLPRLLVSLYEAAIAEDGPQTDTLHEQLQRLSVLYEAPTVAAGIRNLKSALQQLGVIATDQMCAPYGGASGSQGVRTVLHTLGLIDTDSRNHGGRDHGSVRSAM